MLTVSLKVDANRHFRIAAMMMCNCYHGFITSWPRKYLLFNLLRRTMLSTPGQQQQQPFPLQSKTKKFAEYCSDIE